MQHREEFDTALARIRHEIKGRLVQHGFFGSVTYKDLESTDHILSGSTVEITVNGKPWAGHSVARRLKAAVFEWAEQYCQV